MKFRDFLDKYKPPLTKEQVEEIFLAHEQESDPKNPMRMCKKCEAKFFVTPKCPACGSDDTQIIVFEPAWRRR